MIRDMRCWLLIGIFALIAAPLAAAPSVAASREQAKAAAKADVGRAAKAEDPSSSGVEPPTNPAVWSETEQVAALQACLRTFASIKTQIVGIEPVRREDCGSPVLVEVSAIGDAPTVTFKPPIKINCQMVPAIAAWLTAAVQPAAQKHFDRPVVGLRGVGGYACRKRNGTREDRLSEHAFGNALDVAEFEFRGGKRVSVERGWGIVARDLVKPEGPTAAGAEPPVTGVQTVTATSQAEQKPARLTRRERRLERQRLRAERREQGRERRREDLAKLAETRRSANDAAAGPPPLPLARELALGVLTPVRNPKRVSPDRARLEAKALLVKAVVRLASVGDGARGKPANRPAYPSAADRDVATGPSPTSFPGVKSGLGAPPPPTTTDQQNPVRVSRRVVAAPAPTKQAPTKQALVQQATAERTSAARQTPTVKLSAQATPAAQTFLRELHDGACKVFGTVLGPEANDAHRDHFHLDLAPRRRSNYCR